MYKAVISDLDGTLLNHQHQVSPATRATLHALVAQGVRFMVATGRHLIDVRGIRETLGFGCDLITANGALVSDAEDRVLVEHTLHPELADDLLDLAFPAELLVDLHLYKNDGWYVGREMPRWLAYHTESGFRYRVVDMGAIDRSGINKVLYTGEHDALLALEAHLVDRYGAETSVTFSSLDCLEVMPANVNKGIAAKERLEVDGIGMDEVVAFGDGMNDLELLSMVGTSFVMENATERLKEALPHLPLAPGCDADGVAVTLRRLFLL